MNILSSAYEIVSQFVYDVQNTFAAICGNGEDIDSGFIEIIPSSL